MCVCVCVCVCVCEGTEHAQAQCQNQNTSIGGHNTDELHIHTQHKMHGPTCQGVTDFSEKIKAMSFSSCWGDSPNLSTWTTRNARTYLQPQLQKAVGISDAARKGQVNLKVCGYIHTYMNTCVCLMLIWKVCGYMCVCCVP